MDRGKEWNAGLTEEEARELKRRTRARMAAYRHARGLRCWSQLAMASGVTASRLGGMFLGERAPVKSWKKVSAGLDKIEQEESHDRTGEA